MSNNKLGQEPAFANQKSIPIGIDGAGNKKYDVRLTGGMSKRLYIATMAMQGILANTGLMSNTDDIGYVVNYSYRYADELLKQELE